VSEAALLSAELVPESESTEILTQYAPMRAVLTLSARAARSDSAVLVSGEPGTGKTLVARWLHRVSHRAAAPLVEVDCATVPGDVLERELFGYGHGAFPGVMGSKLGLIEVASGGSVLLRAIDALHPRLQGRLAQAVEVGAVSRLGGEQRVPIDVRLLATSAQDLARRVEEGTFRGDLYYRISATSITLPPLRERAVDIPLLARHFLDRYRGAGAHVLSAESWLALDAYSWPGNVRELRTVIERAVLVAADGIVRPHDLFLPGHHPPHSHERSSDRFPNGT
jgi:transcriptional regulator with PAS, ATPase and Fis domain